jgi:putative membrane protein
MSTALTVADRRLHPGTIAVRFLKDAPQTLIGLPAVLALMSDVGWGLIGLLVLLSVTVLGFTQWLAWRRFQYGVGASEILIESGLFSRNRRSIPFERIQDLDIERGPLHRLFGLAKVKIETGAGGKDEGVLDSVTLPEVDRLRQAIRMAQKGVAETTGVAIEPVAEPQGRTVFAMSPRRVLASGPFNFSLLWVAGLFGVLQTFDDWLPFDLYDAERWMGFAEQRLPGRIAVSAIVAGLVLAFLMGFLTGMVRTTLRDWGFRLLAEGKRLRRTRGLFTRTEVVIPKRRVQLALLLTGPLRKRLGIFELMFQTLGSSQGQGGLQTVAPFARTAEVNGIMAELPEAKAARRRGADPGFQAGTSCAARSGPLCRRESRSSRRRYGVRRCSSCCCSCRCSWAPPCCAAVITVTVSKRTCCLCRRAFGSAGCGRCRWRTRRRSA